MNYNKCARYDRIFFSIRKEEEKTGSEVDISMLSIAFVFLLFQLLADVFCPQARLINSN